MKKLPEFLREYFWDVEFDKINLERSKVYILKRILDFGNEKAIAWMFKNFKKSELKNTLSHFRGLSQKSANYWALILGLSKEDVLCLRKRLSREPKTIWPY